MIVDNVEVAGAAPVDGGAPLGAGTPAGAQATGTEQPPAQQMQTTEPKVVTVPSAAMKRIKEEERMKGRQEALATLAQQAGFESDVDLVTALAQLKKGPQPAQAASTPPPAQAQQAQAEQAAGSSPEELAQLRNDRREAAKYERMVEKLTRERDTFASKYQSAAQELKAQREKLDAKDAEMALREVAVSKGVQDVDYALRLYFREVEGKGAEQVDEGAFFDSLRKSKPYLFGEVVRPATTGTGGSAPPTPKPGQAAAAAAQAGQFDGRKASPQEIKERLAKMGLNPHL